MHWPLMAATAIVGLLAACADEPTRRVGNARASGFLSDYSILQKRQEGEAVLAYRNLATSGGKYDKGPLEPVTVWLAGDSSLKKVEPAQRQQLADASHATLNNQSSRHARRSHGFEQWPQFTH